MNDKPTEAKPEQPQPVTQESLARTWVIEQFGTDGPGSITGEIGSLGFLAGYRANAERNADLAQRLDLSEEALKRHGFELGVVKDVPTWVPSASRENLGILLRRVAELTDERAALKTAAADCAKAAEASAKLVEKLTEEREEAAKSFDEENQQTNRILNIVRNADPQGFDSFGENRIVERIELAVLKLRDRRDALKAELAKLKAFKNYVHGRLDEMGVPENIEDIHLGEGCRVGGRLDFLRAELAKAREEIKRRMTQQQIAHEREVAFRAELSAAREACDTYQRNISDGQAQLSAANAAREKSDATIRQHEHDVTLHVEAETRWIVERDDLRRQLAEAQKESRPTWMEHAAEAAWKEARRESYGGPRAESDLNHDWLNSETCRLHSETEAGA